MVLQSHGAAVVIEEKNLTGELLCETVKELTENPERLARLSANAKAMAIENANERIRNEIISLVEG